MKQPFAQVELWLIRPLFVETSLALLFRQRGTVAAILSPLEILLKLPIALGHLLLAERNHPAPVSTETANPVASCLPDSAQSAPRSPAPDNHETQPAYGDRVPLPEWP